MARKNFQGINSICDHSASTSYIGFFKGLSVKSIKIKKKLLKDIIYPYIVFRKYKLIILNNLNFILFVVAFGCAIWDYMG